MLKPYRTEVITFAVAITAALAVFLGLEWRKPGRGVLSGGTRETNILHKDTGAVLLESKSRIGGLLRFAAHRRRAQAASPGATPDPEAWESVDLTGADLKDFNLSHSDISGLVVRRGLFNNSDFRESLLTRTDFEGSEFRRANFSRAVMDHSNFSNATLRAARLIAASAQGTSFRGADLTDADLSGANLKGTDFTGADLLGVLFSGSTEVRDALFVDTHNMSEEFREFAESRGALFQVPDVGAGLGEPGGTEDSR